MSDSKKAPRKTSLSADRFGYSFVANNRLAIVWAFRSVPRALLTDGYFQATRLKSQLTRAMRAC